MKGFVLTALGCLALFAIGCGEEAERGADLRARRGTRVLVLWLEKVTPGDLGLRPWEPERAPEFHEAIAGARVYDEAVAPSDHGATAQRALLEGLPPLPAPEGKERTRTPESLPDWLRRHGAVSLVVREGAPLPSVDGLAFDHRLDLPPHGLETPRGLQRFSEALQARADDACFVLVRARCAAFPIDLGRAKTFPPRWQDLGSRGLLQELKLSLDEGERLLAWGRSSLPRKPFQRRRILEYLFAGPEALRTAWDDGAFLHRLGAMVQAESPSQPSWPVQEALALHRRCEGRRSAHALPRILKLLEDLNLRRSTHVIVMAPSARQEGALRRGAFLPGNLEARKLVVPLVVLPPQEAPRPGTEGLAPMAAKAVERIPQPVATLGLAATVCARLGLSSAASWRLSTFENQILDGREAPIIAANAGSLVVRTASRRLEFDGATLGARLFDQGAFPGRKRATRGSSMLVQSLRNSAWALYGNGLGGLPPELKARYASFARRLLQGRLDEAILPSTGPRASPRRSTGPGTP